MNSRLDEFREFVNRYPKLRDEVNGGKRTWQNIYEEWVLYGENNPGWQAYRDPSKKQGPINREGNNLNINMDGIRNIVGHLQKINPDAISRTLNSIQKVIQIAQSFGGKSKTASYIRTPYDDWWD
ncbi:MAG: spore coat protein YlbD [Bacilli bacterium]|nr:spore coat protein YlbD [Bacilli bacterium]